MKKVVSLAMIAFAFMVMGTGCVEHRYYVQHRDHSPRWYRHHPNHHSSVELRVRN